VRASIPESPRVGHRTPTLFRLRNTWIDRNAPLASKLDQAARKKEAVLNSSAGSRGHAFLSAFEATLIIHRAPRLEPHPNIQGDLESQASKVETPGPGANRRAIGSVRWRKVSGAEGGPARPLSRNWTLSSPNTDSRLTLPARTISRPRRRESGRSRPRETPWAWPSQFALCFRSRTATSKCKPFPLIVPPDVDGVTNLAPGRRFHRWAVRSMAPVWASSVFHCGAAAWALEQG